MLSMRTDKIASVIEGLLRMVQRPLVSIIVPIYKVEQYLDECISSIINQTYTNIEIILVDDGSPDRCGEMCDAYAERDQRIKVIHKQNGGLVSARKAGVHQATGEYIGFVDGDDYVLEDLCASAEKVAVKYQADMILFGLTYVYDDRKTFYSELPKEGLYQGQQLKEMIRNQMFGNGRSFKQSISPCAVCKWFRRELIDQVMPHIDERIKDGEDGACSYPCMLLAESVYVCNGMHQYQYRINQASMTHSYNPQWYVSAECYCKWLEERVADYGDRVLKRALNTEQFRQFYRYVDREFGSNKRFRDKIKTMRIAANMPTMNKVLQRVRLEEMELSKNRKRMIDLMRRGHFNSAYLIWAFLQVWVRCQETFGKGKQRA